MFLNRFIFTLEHIKGKDNVLADLLSRNFFDDQEDDGPDYLKSI